jgi:hypothetical protein
LNSDILALLYMTFIWIEQHRGVISPLQPCLMLSSIVKLYTVVDS